MTEPNDPRKVQWGMDEFLFATPKSDPGGSGFGTVPSWLPTSPVSRPVKLVRYLRHKWFRGLVLASYSLGLDLTKSAPHRWLFDQDCRASRLWLLAQVKHNQTIVFKGFYGGPPEDTR